MDAFELLKTDHKKVSRLFEEIESASGQAKAQLFERLKSELDLHAHIEETYLYPALENKKEARDITLEAYEEHKLVKDLLAELAGSRAPNDEWDAKLKVLKENVDHHVEEEEGELFDKAEDVLSEEDIERLGDQMEAEKLRKQGGPTPSQREAQTETAQKAKRSSHRAGDSGPGVLKRLAKLVGLGDSSSGKRKTAKPKGTKSSATKSSKKKSSGKKSASKGRSSKGTKKTTAVASRIRSAGKSSVRSKPASKSEAGRKAAKGRAASKRSSGRKAASRGTGARSRGR